MSVFRRPPKRRWNLAPEPPAKFGRQRDLPIRFQIDKLTTEDRHAALALDSLAFAGIPAETWPRDAFERAWHGRHTHTLAFKMVDRQTDLLAGIAMFKFEDSRVTCLRLAVETKWRGLGIGRALLHEVQDHDESRRPFVSFVYEENIVACRFLNRCGYYASGLARPRDGIVYADGRDAYRFVREWAGPAAPLYRPDPRD